MLFSGDILSGYDISVVGRSYGYTPYRFDFFCSLLSGMSVLVTLCDLEKTS